MYYLGVDVGSVSTDIVVLDEKLNVYDQVYLRTKGRPIEAIQRGFKQLKNKYKDKEVRAIGTTGSGRGITSFILGADCVKNEITAHAMAGVYYDKEVKTIFEIGGQDSKIILLNQGVVTDFAMNTVCAAGTGSFLDRQAERLGIPIEEFGNYALKSKLAVRIAGRCAVFAESDMIHKQQLGYDSADIIKGLCEALARNYLNNVGKGKDIQPKVFFQGGVAANIGIKEAFEKILGFEIFVPKYYNVMGAIGAALLAKETVESKRCKTNFKGFDISDHVFITNSFQCKDCPNECEVVRILDGEVEIGCFGDRCGKWNQKSHIKSS